MATRRRKVIWTLQARTMPDDAVSYVAEDSIEATVKLLTAALDTAESLATLSERGRRSARNQRAEYSGIVCAALSAYL